MNEILKQLKEDTDLFAPQAPKQEEVIYRVGNADGSIMLTLTKDGVEGIKALLREQPHQASDIIYVEGLPIPLNLFLGRKDGR